MQGTSNQAPREHGTPRRLALGLLTAIAMTVASPGLAQTVSAPRDPAIGPSAGNPEQSAGADVEQAYSDLIMSALAAYDGGRWSAALQDFQRAHALKPSARTLRTMGMCAFNLGDFGRAAATLEGALSSGVRPLSGEQRLQAQELVERSMTRLAELRLTTTPEAGTVLVDGQRPPQLQSGAFLIAPGPHELRVQAQGHHADTQPLSLVAGQKLQLAIQLSPIGIAVSAEAPVTPVGPPAQSDTSVSQTLGVVALIGGGASMATSLITALLGYGMVNELKNDCPNHACPSESHGSLARYDRYRTLSTITFYGGIGLAALGATLLLLDGDDDGQPAVTVSAGPTFVRIGGTL